MWAAFRKRDLVWIFVSSLARDGASALWALRWVAVWLSTGGGLAWFLLRR